MSSTDHVDDGAFVLRLERPAMGRALPAPLRAALATVYATTLVLALLMPHAVINWLDDQSPGPLNSFARSCMEPVALLSDRLGMHALHDGVRQRTERWSRRAQ